jgi:integrase
LVTKIEAEDAQQMVYALMTRYSPSSVRQVNGVLSLALQFCIRRKWLVRNILRDSRLSLPQQTRRESVPSIEDLKRLLDVIWDWKPFEDLVTNVNRVVLVTFMICAGLRPCEVFALQWDDVDFDKKKVRIRRSQTYKDGLRATTKTKAGLRSVDLAPPMEAALGLVAQYYGAKALAEAPGYSPTKRATSFRLHKYFKEARAAEFDRTGYILMNRFGRPMNSTEGGFMFRKLRERAGLGKEISLYSLRHAHASLLLRSGRPSIEVKTRMGHARIQTTIDTYGHLFPEDDGLSQATMAISNELTAPNLQQLPATPCRKRLL